MSASHNALTRFDLFAVQVTCGFASDALTQFLSTGLTEVQITRMRKAVDTGTGQVTCAASVSLYSHRDEGHRSIDGQERCIACSPYLVNISLIFE